MVGRLRWFKQMLDLKPIIETILEDYALPLDGHHGVSHWARVLENGLRLADETKANIEVVQLFAIFHDSRRINEGFDDGHGKRGADLAAELRDKYFSLSDQEFNLLYAACADHTEGKTDGDITVQTCWDADRLDLGRVRVQPHPQKLCTAAAKNHSILKWADGRACFQIVPELVKIEWGINIKE
jgi:uncharacterized protein